MGRRHVSLAAAGAMLVWGVPARADVGDTIVAIGYVSSIAAGGIATAVNGSALAFGEPSPRGWRIFGYVTGGVDIVWGGVILAAASDRSEGIVLGSLALAVGGAALATAFFVDEDLPPTRLRALPLVLPGGGGLAFTGCF